MTIVHRDGPRVSGPLGQGWMFVDTVTIKGGYARGIADLVQAPGGMYMDACGSTVRALPQDIARDYAASIPRRQAKDERIRAEGDYVKAVIMLRRLAEEPS